MVLIAIQNVLRHISQVYTCDRNTAMRLLDESLIIDEFCNTLY